MKFNLPARDSGFIPCGLAFLDHGDQDTSDVLELILWYLYYHKHRINGLTKKLNNLNWSNRFIRGNWHANLMTNLFKSTHNIATDRAKFVHHEKIV